MSSSLSSPLLHRLGPDTGDVAQAATDPEKPLPSSPSYSLGQLPIPSTEETADGYSTARMPKVLASTTCGYDDNPARLVGRHKQEQEEQQQEGLVSSRKSRLVWDGSGFIPGSSELGSEFQELGFRRLSSRPKDELRRFRCSLFWLGLDQSTPFRTLASWTAVTLLAIGIPVCYLVLVDTEASSVHAGHPFDRLVQTSEAALALISFACLSHNLRKHGLRGFLFLDQISLEPVEVQSGYIGELNRAFRLLQLILLPSFVTELVHQIWWFTIAPINFSLIQSSGLKSALFCTAVMVSWLYKTTVFLLPCILFRLMCYLQNLRFEGYIKMLETVSEVSVILKQYMRLRQQLNIISHRYRMFIILSLVTITASQFMFLLMITATSGSVNFLEAGNLGVCSVVQLIGFVICLHGAARITHRAQRIVSIVSQWHAISTCQHYEVTRQDTKATNCTSICWVDEEDQLGAAEYDNDLSTALNMYSTTYNEVSNNDIAAFQMRQAFVSFVQHSSTGISIFGFMLDRIHLQMIFMIQLSLVLWVLGKTVGVSS
ncbi:hypothetical protein GOP47_0007300 [Adiantum capillus-veneris]|uniref:Uncharacterized protein n=1 Tax=Adiantum capillus-veneris TaxID=13818 RepID=A0A9D4V0F0_ADICA|nr:hypothetical protein GOP47_0007300 [Adiantum capillus-veneris]